MGKLNIRCDQIGTRARNILDCD